MPINSISIKNFKCFDECDVEFSKLTLLTGKNSSGKSSLIDALLAIFQSRYPSYLSPNGKYVEMGDFTEMVLGYDQNKEITIDIRLSGPTGVSCDYQTKWGIDLKSRMPIVQRIIIDEDSFIYDVKKSGNKYILNVKNKENISRTKKSKDAENLIFSILDTMDKLISDEEGQERLPFSEQKNIVDYQFDNFDRLGNSLLAAGYGYNSFIVSKGEGIIESIDSNLNYIGPFREQPKRNYDRKAKPSEKVDRFGNNCIDQILDWKDSASPEFKQLTQSLREMDVVHRIRFRKSRGGKFEPRIVTSNYGAWSSLIDVGFGVSQLLPIIVADIQMRKNSTLIVAQPEMHLHPSAQADFADYFIKQVNENQKNYILETHSEYLINRIRAKIVKGVIKPNDVSLYYFENSGEICDYHMINLTADGQIKGAPKGFFETYQMEIMDIALNT